MIGGSFALFINLSADFGNLFGILVIITLLGTTVFIGLFNENQIVNIHKGQQIKRQSYIYLLTEILAVFGICVGNILRANTYYPLHPLFWLGTILLYGSYFGIFFLGIRFVFSLKGSWNQPPESTQISAINDSTINRKPIIKPEKNLWADYLTYSGLIAATIFTGIISYVIIGPVSILIRFGVFIGFAEFFALVLFVRFALLWKKTHKYWYKGNDNKPENQTIESPHRTISKRHYLFKRHFYAGITVSMLVMSIINFLPLIYIPNNIQTAETAVQSAFGAY